MTQCTEEQFGKLDLFIKDLKNQPIPELEYQIHIAGKVVASGKTDAKGKGETTKDLRIGSKFEVHVKRKQGDYKKVAQGVIHSKNCTATLNSPKIHFDVSTDVDKPVHPVAEIKTEDEEEMITIIVELPHSKETGWGAKGLAGHTAMAIGGKFFDYGPDYSEAKTFDEKQYDADLNRDGDLEDKVRIGDIPNAGFHFAPGRPWWGEAIALKNTKKATEVTLTEAIFYITKLPWESNSRPMVQGTYIYGTVYKIEFYVKKSEAIKMLEWWVDRYQHLKIYSVEPWTGEQCTTAVKQALAYGGIDDIDWETLTPNGILEDLKTEIKSTSIQHKDEKAKITLIKKEAIDWEP